MILNVTSKTFGGPLRMGDIVACANVVAHFRLVENNNDIKFYLETGVVSSSTYVSKFYQWMIANTDYFSSSPGTEHLPWQRVNLWDYRDISGDLVTIPNTKSRQHRVVVNPLLAADYNYYRIWPTTVFEQVIAWVENTYPDHELVLISECPIARDGWRNCTELVLALDEIMTAEIYIGGDTGLSHFVGALQSGPEPIYYYSSRGLIHTTPFFWHTKKKGIMKTYYLNFDNTQW